MEKVMDKIKNFRIKTPVEVFKSFGSWFDSTKKTTVVVAIIVGLLTHVLLLSLLIMSPDGLWNALTYSAGATEVSSGRWFINAMDSLRKNLALPSIVTIMSVIIIAVTSVFINDLMKFKTKISCITTAVFLEVGPYLAMSLLYTYTADVYAWAFLFAAVAAWCIYREKHKIIGFIFGVIFTGLSLGIYQSYLGVVVGLCVLRPMVDVLQNRKYRDIFKNIGISILAVILGIVFYWVAEQIALNKYGISLSSYQGAGNVSIMNSLVNLPSSIYKTYGYFINFFIGGNVVNNPNMSRNVFYKILYVIEGIALIVLLITRKAETKKYKIIDAILIFGMIAFLPIGLNIIIIMVPDTFYYSLNSGQCLLIIPFMMMILEAFDDHKAGLLKWASLCMCFIIAFTYFLADNATYTVVRLRYNQAYSNAVRMMDKIENTDGYEIGKKILIAGIFDENSSPITSEVYFLSYGGFPNGPLFHNNYTGMTETWRKFLQVYLGIQPNFASVEEYFQICGTEEFKNMPVFPAQGCTAEINDVIVIKLNQDVPVN